MSAVALIVTGEASADVACCSLSLRCTLLVEARACRAGVSERVFSLATVLAVRAVIKILIEGPPSISVPFVCCGSGGGGGEGGLGILCGGWTGGPAWCSTCPAAWWLRGFVLDPPLRDSFFKEYSLSDDDGVSFLLRLELDICAATTDDGVPENPLLADSVPLEATVCRNCGDESGVDDDSLSELDLRGPREGKSDNGPDRKSSSTGSAPPIDGAARRSSAWEAPRVGARLPPGVRKNDENVLKADGGLGAGLPPLDASEPLHSESRRSTSTLASSSP